MTESNTRALSLVAIALCLIDAAAGAVGTADGRTAGLIAQGTAEFYGVSAAAGHL